MDEINIRRMTSKDAEAVSQIEQQSFSQPWSCQGFLNALAMGNVIFLVAETEEKLVGYCGMYCAADEGEITNVAVSMDYRQQGIAGKLVKRLLAEAGYADIKKIILEVRISNEGAIHLYESLGFIVSGVRKGFYENPREDGYVMSLNQ